MTRVKKTKISNQEKVADVKLCGHSSEPFSRFGHDVIVQDFNADGISDLVVAAPTSGLRDVTYDGAVKVFFGGNEASLFGADADVTIRPPKSTSSRSSTFGWSLASIK